MYKTFYFSDGFCRVFTEDEERKADPSKLKVSNTSELYYSYQKTY